DIGIHEDQIRGFDRRIGSAAHRGADIGTGQDRGIVHAVAHEEDAAQFQMIDFPLSDVVAEAAQSYQAPAKVQNKTFETRIQPMLTLHGDEKAIRQLTGILLDNALKYTPEGGRIALELERQGRSVRLAVSNTAEDIDPASLDRLFDRFYRADASRSSQTGGYGIGLSIARAIVAAHRGKIAAASPDGRSLTITASMPQ
ncbi:MAG: GHKL domain-containing protein, partial [Clostridia bacterium]|nr:GHKL domain-containing protein [Clostridia bacterium]